MFYKCFTTGFVGMATIKEVVLKHHKKEDGTYNIKYRLTHSENKPAIVKNGVNYNRSKILLCVTCLIGTGAFLSTLTTQNKIPGFCNRFRGLDSIYFFIWLKNQTAHELDNVINKITQESSAIINKYPVPSDLDTYKN